jgi:uncharacterized protein (TIGR02452 family)
MSSRQELAEIYQDTIWQCVDPRKPTYVVPKPLYYDEALLENSTTEIKPRFESTKIIVENEDSFDFAKKFLDNGDTTPKGILVLNMASSKRPGGGVENGATAQEECLFRRSNYFIHLPSHLYRLPPDALIVSRNVIVIKDRDHNMYDDLGQKPFAVNCIAVASMVNPKTANYDKDGVPINYKHERDYTKIKTKIRNLFHVAYLNGFDTLVLGALGCGAFHNPVYDVAQIFREVIVEFKGCFKTVSFAVLSWNKDKKYEIFKTHIETALKGEVFVK